MEQREWSKGSCLCDLSLGNGIMIRTITVPNELWGLEVGSLWMMSICIKNDCGCQKSVDARRCHQESVDARRGHQKSVDARRSYQKSVVARRVCLPERLSKECKCQVELERALTEYSLA